MKESAVPVNATGMAVVHTGDDGLNHAPPGITAFQRMCKKARQCKKARRKKTSARKDSS